MQTKPKQSLFLYYLMDWAVTMYQGSYVY